MLNIHRERKEVYERNEWVGKENSMGHSLSEVASLEKAVPGKYTRVIPQCATGPLLSMSQAGEARSRST